MKTFEKTHRGIDPSFVRCEHNPAGPVPLKSTDPMCDEYAFDVVYLRDPMPAEGTNVELWTTRSADCGYHANCG